MRLSVRPSPKNFDALVIGYYDGTKLIYAAPTRNGFTPASRVQLYKRLKPLELDECPFANLPEKKAARGREPDCGQNGRVPMAKTLAGRAVRVCGMDRGRPPSAQPVYGAGRGQEGARHTARELIGGLFWALERALPPFGHIHTRAAVLADICQHF